MSFLSKFLPKRFSKPSGPATPDIISKIADDVRKNLAADSPRPFVEAYREFRQHRLDAHIRRELAKTRAYGIASRPRLPQADTKVVGVSKHYLELANGQIVRRDGILRNPVLRGLRAEALTQELLKAA